MTKKITVLISVLVTGFSFSQEKVWDTFEGTRALNNHSTEMLFKKNLEFRVTHKFGDIAGTDGGLETFYGLDNLGDVRIGFEYGVTDNINIGYGRNKGVNERTGVVDLYGKYRFMQQEKDGKLFNMTYVSSLAFSYKKASTDSTSSNNYQSASDRLIFTNQIIVSRKFSDRLSLQLNAGYHHRNLVTYNDVNGMFFTGGVFRFRFTKTLGIITEYNHVWNRSSLTDQTNPLAVGFEIITGGHNFTLVVSNHKGVNENIFLSNTTSDWLKGQWRIGFSINRKFKF
jgi:hypothetical protein